MKGQEDETKEESNISEEKLNSLRSDLEHKILALSDQSRKFGEIFETQLSNWTVSKRTGSSDQQQEMGALSSRSLPLLLSLDRSLENVSHLRNCSASIGLIRDQISSLTTSILSPLDEQTLHGLLS